MVISDEYRYVFIQIPMTGCTAVASELIRRYGGRHILTKHATYKQFYQQASAEQRSYFIFASIRNPFDRVVSHYHKFLSNHEDYLNPEKHQLQSAQTTRYQLTRVSYIRQTEANFSQYFRKFYRRLNPKLPPHQLAIEQAQFVARFENLARDFLTVLHHLEISAEGELPLVNPTPEREKSFVQYYDESICKLASSAIGPFARYWGYEIPSEWSTSIPKYATSIFNAKMIARNLIRYR